MTMCVDHRVLCYKAFGVKNLLFIRKAVETIKKTSKPSKNNFSLTKLHRNAMKYKNYE